jgi:hypothetical protein
MKRLKFRELLQDEFINVRVGIQECMLYLKSYVRSNMPHDGQKSEGCKGLA